jgi:hypothetical protein
VGGPLVFLHRIRRCRHTTAAPASGRRRILCSPHTSVTTLTPRRHLPSTTFHPASGIFIPFIPRVSCSRSLAHPTTHLTASSRLPISAIPRHSFVIPRPELSASQKKKSVRFLLSTNPPSCPALVLFLPMPAFARRFHHHCNARLSALAYLESGQAPRRSSTRNRLPHQASSQQVTSQPPPLLNLRSPSPSTCFCAYFLAHLQLPQFPTFYHRLDACSCISLLQADHPHPSHLLTSLLGGGNRV